MEISRRNLAGVSGLALLTGCGLIKGNPLQTVVNVNLATAQAEAAAIYQALSTFIGAAESVVSPSIANTITSVFNDLGIAVKAFSSLTPSASNVGALAQDVLGFVSQLMPLIPATILPASTSTAIKFGLMILSALIAGMSTVTVPTPVTTVPSSSVKAPQVIIAPIPIPLS